MHIPDLHKCRYGDGHLHARSWNVPLLAVGWLEHPHLFPRAPINREFLAKFLSLVHSMAAAYPTLNSLGYQQCSLCEAEGVHDFDIKSSAVNVFVPGSSCVYVAPGGLEHYVAQHFYQPPAGFVAAVLGCPAPDTAEYRIALRTVNQGPIPLPVRLRDSDGAEYWVSDQELESGARGPEGDA